MSSEDSIKRYEILKNRGFTPVDIFKEAKTDDLKNFECINILMILFDMSLDEARKISHNYYSDRLY